MGEFGGATPKAKELALTNGAPEPKGSEEFHDHRVLGRIEITDAKRKNDLLAELYRGVENSQASPAACFNPRHGVVAVQGTNRVQLLICFECDQGTEFSESGQKWFSIGKEPRELFDRTLTEAGVPLAKH